MDLKDKIFIKYDIETFLNIFCVVFKFEDRYLVFEISERKNELEKLITFIKNGIDKNWFFVGFNNVRFDAQILQWLLDEYKEGRRNITSNDIHSFAQEIIAKSNAKQFPPYPEYKLEFKQIDLFLQNHYNNVARSTSLKWLEYSMNWSKVQDLPYKHDEEIGVDVFDSIIEYCKNDVDATDEFFKKCDKLLELRFAQDKMYPELNLLNKSDSSVGEAIFLDLMSKKLNVPKHKLKKKQTHHSKIHLKDVILPKIKFLNKEFNGVLDFFKTTTITNENQSFKHSVMFGGIEYVYGVGGLHASLSNAIVEETETEILVDVDVSSYYPNLSIRNGFYPKHLSKQFCDLYEYLYDVRKEIPKSNPQNKSLKLLLNSIYGKSGDIYSFVYDKFFQMCITVNGQLLLTMLVEQLSRIEGVNIFYANTDGITIKMDKTKKKQVYHICKWFEKFTGLELEYANYKKMIIRDVNNYIAILKDDSIKLKGAFEIDVDYHKNRSQRIVPIAVKRHFVHGVPVEDTITQHLVHNKNYGDIENQGIYDFCIGKKIKGNQQYSLEKKLNRVLPNHKNKEEQRDFLESNGWIEREQNEWINDYEDFTEKKGYGFTDSYRRCIDQVHPEYEIVREINDKVLRFYVSSDGLYLNKNYSDGRREVTVGGNKVTIFMDYEEKNDYKIDYQYYIDEANKIIHEVDGTKERKLEEEKKKREIEKQQKELEKQQKENEYQERMFVKYCVEKSPTKLQWERYKDDWLIDKYGEPEEIR